MISIPRGWQLERTLEEVVCLRPCGREAMNDLAAVADAVRNGLATRGAVLLRDLCGLEASSFARLVKQSAGGPLLNYTERSSPRTLVAEGVYTSTHFSSRESIAFHNENSYQLSWPGLLAFWCRKPAERGGSTLIADVARVHDAVSPQIRARFAAGYVIVRNFNPGLGLPWQEVFGTADHAAVEGYCEANALALEWTDRGLRTRAQRRTVARHPATGAPLWFNHLSFFNVHSLRPRLRDTMLASMPEGELPSNTYDVYGSPIDADTIGEIAAAYQSAAREVVWQAGDVLLIDNMWYAHARQPYSGAREVYVAMALPRGHSPS